MNLVCPRCLSHLNNRDNRLVCNCGASYPIEKGVPDLRILDDPLETFHHIPRREFGRIGFFGRLNPSVIFYRGWSFWIGSYENYIRGAGGGNVARDRIAFRLRLPQMVLRQKKLIDRMLGILSKRYPEHAERPIENFSEGIYVSGAPASSFFKRIEKEFFWDHVRIESPAYEFGVSGGHSSAYAFRNRKIELGSEYDLLALHSGRHPHEKLFAANVKYIPLASNSLQTVICSQTIPCVYVSLISALTEINRVLAKGGTLAMTVHGPAFLHVLPREGVPELGLSATDCIVHNEMRAGYMKHLYSHEEWREILAVCGFELISTRGIGWLKTAMFSQIFHNFEFSSYPIFMPEFKQSRICRLLFGGRARQEDYERKLNKILTIIYNVERENPRAEWDSGQYVEGGLVAIKKHDVPSTRRVSGN
jgi:SAM-dependent methyltransferase